MNSNRLRFFLSGVFALVIAAVIGGCLIGRSAATSVPRMEAEAKALGRSFGEHTAEH